MSRLATGAKEIWDLRMSGKKPNEVVFISLIGPLNSGNFQVLAPNGGFADYDWRWVRDLSVCLVYDNSSNPRAASELTRLLVRCAPNGGYTKFSTSFGYLWTWNASTQKGQLVTWWQGHEAVPELGIDGQPEQIDIAPLSRWEKKSFEGVEAA